MIFAKLMVLMMVNFSNDFLDVNCSHGFTSLVGMICLCRLYLLGICDLPNFSIFLKCWKM